MTCGCGPGAQAVRIEAWEGGERARELLNFCTPIFLPVCDRKYRPWSQEWFSKKKDRTDVGVDRVEPVTSRRKAAKIPLRLRMLASGLKRRLGIPTL
eukprot:scaffold101823_cov27-Phaeocystis_antarctica.AAC.1